MKHTQLVVIDETYLQQYQSLHSLANWPHLSTKMQAMYHILFQQEFKHIYG